MSKIYSLLFIPSYRKAEILKWVEGMDVHIESSRIYSEPDDDGLSIEYSSIVFANEQDELAFNLKFGNLDIGMF